VSPADALEDVGVHEGLEDLPVLVGPLPALEDAAAELAHDFQEHLVLGPVALLELLPEPLGQGRAPASRRDGDHQVPPPAEGGKDEVAALRVVDNVGQDAPPTGVAEDPVIDGAVVRRPDHEKGAVEVGLAVIVRHVAHAARPHEPLEGRRDCFPHDSHAGPALEEALRLALPHLAAADDETAPIEDVEADRVIPHETRNFPCKRK